MRVIKVLIPSHVAIDLYYGVTTEETTRVAARLIQDYGTSNIVSVDSIEFGTPDYPECFDFEKCDIASCTLLV